MMGRVVAELITFVPLLLVTLNAVSRAQDSPSLKRTDWSEAVASVDGPAIPSKYQPVPNGFRTVGSERTFNRALYGGHAQDDLQNRYYTLAGDQPLFLGSIISTQGGGSNAKCGTLMLGVSQSFGTDASNKY